MNDNVVKTCVRCKNGKCLENYYKKHSECKACNIKRVLKRINNTEDEMLQQRRNKNARFKNLGNRLKALKQKLSIV